MSTKLTLACALFTTLGTPFLAGCATSGGRGGTEGLAIAGDENGGKIPSSIGGGKPRQASAFQMVTAYCAQFEKKGFITQMDFETGVMTFECRRQSVANQKR